MAQLCTCFVRCMHTCLDALQSHETSAQCGRSQDKQPTLETSFVFARSCPSRALPVQPSGPNRTLSPFPNFATSAVDAVFPPHHRRRKRSNQGLRSSRAPHWGASTSEPLLHRTITRIALAASISLIGRGGRPATLPASLLDSSKHPGERLKRIAASAGPFCGVAPARDTSCEKSAG